MSWGWLDNVKQGLSHGSQEWSWGLVTAQHENGTGMAWWVGNILAQKRHNGNGAVVGLNGVWDIIDTGGRGCDPSPDSKVAKCG